jgi:cytochrome c-type biogenesis protein CcmH
MTAADLPQAPARADSAAAPGTARPDSATAGSSTPGSPPSVASRRSGGRIVGWLALAVVLVGALVFGAVDDGGARSPDERARNLAGSIACPQCDGQSVADSDSDAADGIRSVIERRIAEGASDAEIRDELAAAYGERVLLTPGRSGVSSLVWTLPVVVVVVAFAGLTLAFRRWRGGAGARASDADRALVARARADAATDPAGVAGDDTPTHEGAASGGAS